MMNLLTFLLSVRSLRVRLLDAQLGLLSRRDPETHILCAVD